MPFALGIAGSYEKGAGAVGWAWAVNGLFTVLGSIMCVIAAIYVGFAVTLMVAFGLYLLAGLLLPRFSTGLQWQLTRITQNSPLEVFHEI